MKKQSQLRCRLGNYQGIEKCQEMACPVTGPTPSPSEPESCLQRPPEATAHVCGERASSDGQLKVGIAQENPNAAGEPGCTLQDTFLFVNQKNKSFGSF